MVYADILDKMRLLIGSNIDVIEIREILEKNGYNYKVFDEPNIKIESYKGKIIDQQLIIIYFYDINKNKFDIIPNCEYFYLYNGRNRLYRNVSSIKYGFIKESIMFDIYMSSNFLKFNKEIVNNYKSHNEKILKEIEAGRPISQSLNMVVDEKKYNKFVNKMIMNSDDNRGKF